MSGTDTIERTKGMNSTISVVSIAGEEANNCLLNHWQNDPQGDRRNSTAATAVIISHYPHSLKNSISMGLR